MSRYDRHCLAVETDARPIHLGILAELEPTGLTDPDGRLRIADIRRVLDGRIAALPELRRVVVQPGPLGGGPIWIDDPSFRIERHVRGVELSAPGDEPAWRALVEQLLAWPLDRSRPLWQIWFVTGLAEGRVGALVVLHHALADGQAAMRMVRSLLGPPMAFEGPDMGDAPVPPPRWAALVIDNLGRIVESALRLLRPATWRLALGVVLSMRRVGALARAGAVTSLNAPVGRRRRLAVVRLDLHDAKRVARRYDCGVNDVVLSLISGGVRALLDGRDECVTDLRPRAGIAVARFDPEHRRAAGNDIGTMYVTLPIEEGDPVRRLSLIAAARTEAREDPLVAIEPVMRAWAGRIGAFRRSLERQRLVNLAETYIPGPPTTIQILGARVLDLIPVAPLAGNVGLSFVALSYAGGLAIAVRADAERFPDVDILTAAMTHDWRALAPSPLSPTRSPETTVAGRSHGPDRRRPRLTRSVAGAGPP